MADRLQLMGCYSSLMLAVVALAKNLEIPLEQMHAALDEAWDVRARLDDVGAALDG